jgi:hypothetical protein
VVDDNICNSNENAEESSMSMKWEKKRDGNYFLGVRTVAEVDAIICKFPECDHSVPISKAHFKKIMGYHIKEKHFRKIHMFFLPSI